MITLSCFYHTLYFQIFIFKRLKTYVASYNNGLVILVLFVILVDKRPLLQFHTYCCDFLPFWCNLQKLIKVWILFHFHHKSVLQIQWNSVTKNSVITNTRLQRTPVITNKFSRSRTVSYNRVWVYLDILSNLSINNKSEIAIIFCAITFGY